MGLDMYLHKKTYVKNWDHMKPENRHVITVSKGGKPASGINVERISEITEEVAYWRKANAIHKWFVDNVQDGKDDCGTYYVSAEKLRELVGLCKQVLGTLETVDGQVHTGTVYDHTGKHEMYEPGKVVAQKGAAEKLLPTQDGFFFGSTNYDEYYMADVQETVDQLEPLLAECEKGEGVFYYSSSW